MEIGNEGGCCMEKNATAVKNARNEKKSVNGSHQVLDTLFDESEFKPYDPTQDPIFPPELKVGLAGFSLENVH